jgi:hypothetical protein
MSEDRIRRHQGAQDTDERAAHALDPGKTTLTGQIRRKLLRKAGPDEVRPDAEDQVARASGSSGSPLPAQVQRKFEDSLGADLSGVRLHSGAESASAAQAVNARAYTVGSDIHFNKGQLDPTSADGERLLAHEVAHTVQQSGGAQRAQYKLEVSSPGDSAELEADRAADAMVRGAPATVSGGLGIARKIMRSEAPGGEGGGSPVSPNIKLTADGSGKFGISGSLTVTSPPMQGSVFTGHFFVKATVSGTASPATTGGAAPKEGAPKEGAPKEGAAPKEKEGGGGPSAGGEVSPKAQGAAIKCTQEIANEHCKGNGDIESIEFEEEASGGNEKKDKAAKLGGKIAVKLKGGLQAYVDCELLAIKDHKDGPIPFDVNIFKVTVVPMKVDVPLGDKVVDDFKVSGNASLEVGGDLEPDKTRLAILLAGKAGPALLEKLGVGAAGSTMLRAIAGMMASAEFNIGAFGAYITVKATLATLEKGDDIQATTKQAMDACYGYKNGFKLGVFGTGGKDGDAAWMTIGFNDGNVALQKKAQEVQQKYASWNFELNEVLQAMRDQLATKADLQQQLGLTVEHTAWPGIKSAYIAAWRSKRGVVEKALTNTESDEDKLAVNLGFKGRSSVPPATNGPVSEGAGAAPK